MIGELLLCAGSRWSPGIGDPTFYGWATVWTFAVASILCALLGLGPKGRPERRFWLLLAVLMALLAVNKQLDLQSGLTAIGRCLSQRQGWYEGRRSVQALFVLALAAAAVLVLALIAIPLRHRLGRIWPAVLGAVFVAAFVMIRAVSFTHVDALLKLPVGAFRLNHLLENGGPLLIALNALVLLARRPPTLPPAPLPARPSDPPPYPPPDPSLGDRAGSGRRVR